MNKFSASIIFLLCCFSIHAQVYDNRVYAPNIRTLRASLVDKDLMDPIIRLGSDDQLTISFDEMSHNPKYYSYSIIHCNADWTPSQMMEIEYMKGFNDNEIEDSERSFNTTFDYIRYWVNIPNENVSPLISGNYILKVYETEDRENLILTARFMVKEENVIGVTGRVKYNTSKGVNKGYQQLDFEVDFSKTPIANPQEELNISIRQNGRRDNEVKGIKPTYIKLNQLIYEDNRDLEFEGGSEFERIDFSHIRNYSGRIARISFNHPYYNVEVISGTRSKTDDYRYDKDINGRYIIHGQDIWSEKEIDYSIVHFVYPREEPWLDGALYVAGYFNDNQLNAVNKMEYNFERKEYELDIVLKNGGYNYQYLFQPYGLSRATADKVSGNHWQTENDYTISIYYRPMGGRYDRLIHVSTINSSEAK
ncbi:MAG TPA: DUF5103 domain-containing protein [Paludibacteraceae bacterium]|nr:DUF5103 domain-containing protein [Paludibacteraceae bacterium]